MTTARIRAWINTHQPATSLRRFLATPRSDATESSAD